MSKKLKYLNRAERDSLYISAEHEIIMLTYYLELDASLKALRPSKEAFRLLSEVINVITDYSNSFSEEKEEYFYEWIRIIPTNLTYAIAGFISGLKESGDIETCNIYYSDVLQSASRCLSALNEIELIDE
jgi:hypothetical protein